MFNYVLGLWIAAGMAIGFAVPPIRDGNLVLQTRQIAYFHVPMAIAMEVAFLLSAFFGVGWLVTRDPRQDMVSLAYAEIGLAFGIITTITGAIFARTNWGVYWNWDPQQVGILTTLLTYCALFTLRTAVDDEDRRRTAWAVYSIVGFLTAILSSMVYRRLLPENATLHPPNTLVTSDPLNKFALWFNVVGYIMLLIRLGQLRSSIEMKLQKIRGTQWATS